MGSIGNSDLSSASTLPPLSWDTHVHVFDSNIGPFASGNAYTPAEAPLAKLLDFSRSLGGQQLPINLVLVQPSPYGTDNSVLLHALEQLNHQNDIRARGIVVVDVRAVTDEQLWRLHHAGVRGLRLNRMASGKSCSAEELIKDIKLAADRIKQLPNWKLQLFISGSLWDDLHDTILSLPVTVVADHVGGMLGSSKLPSASRDPTVQPGFRSLLDLAKQSKVIIKISGLYRLSTEQATGHGDLERIIRRLADTVPGRLIYASDWPHTGDASGRLARNPGQVEGFRTVDNQRILANLRSWIGSEDLWRQLMVFSPASAFE